MIIFCPLFKLLMGLSYALLHSKAAVCTTPMLPRDEMSDWVEKRTLGTELSGDILRARNQTELADELEHYVQHYYELVIYFHYIILVWCFGILFLSCINIVPKHEDMKVLTILTVIIL